MVKNKGGKQSNQEEIFQQMEECDYQNSQQEKSPAKENSKTPYEPEEEQGEILEEEYSPQMIPQSEKQLQAINKNNQNSQLYQDSSEDDDDRILKQKKKRQQLWKHKNNKIDQTLKNHPLTQTQLLDIAFNALQRTNKRVMLMRKKNQKRMDNLEKIRMTQQPYLTTGNTHFRGSSSQYSIITHDSTGKAYYHPNHSFRVGQMKLQNFILKNIKEESTANYLNQVVKFENYAYQQRKKRRHNIE